MSPPSLDRAHPSLPELFPWPTVEPDAARLLQLDLARRAPEPDEAPFRVLVACSLLNRTTGTAPVLRRLFDRWPHRAALAAVPEPDLRAVLRPLGLSAGRAARLLRLADRYPGWAAAQDPEGRYTTSPGSASRVPVRDLPGCGAYAEEAWSLLVLGDLSREPGDPHLARWWRWAVSDPAMREAARALPRPVRPRRRVRP